jgi:hypothetical protein
MTSARSQLATMSLVPRFVVIGFTAALVLGGFVGLLVGLRAYPKTAWFAVLEVGVPSGIGGAVVGALAGLVAVVVQRVSDS